MCYSGLAQAFIYAAVPPLIKDKSQKFFVFALFGIVSATSSFVAGKLSDFLRCRLVVFVVAALAHLIIYGLLLLQWTPPFDDQPIEIFVTMTFCLSIGDSIFMTQLYPVISTFYGKTRPADGFACTRVFQAGLTALGFVAQVYLRFSTQLIILIVVLSGAMLVLVYGHRCVASLDGKTTSVTLPIDTNIDVNIPLSDMSSNEQL
jgi:hypothetical protein